jgi:hypothetical protein
LDQLKFELKPSGPGPLTHWWEHGEDHSICLAYTAEQSGESNAFPLEKEHAFIPACPRGQGQGLKPFKSGEAVIKSPLPVVLSEDMQGNCNCKQATPHRTYFYSIKLRFLDGSACMHDCRSSQNDLQKGHVLLGRLCHHDTVMTAGEKYYLNIL